MRTLKEDLYDGFRREEFNHSAICKHLGVYMMPTPPSHTVDWIECIPEENCIPYVAEQKSRNISYNQCRDFYGTAPIGKNKIDYIANNGDGVIYMDFTDGLYFIQWEPEVFKKFETRMYGRNPRPDSADRPTLHTFIPCNLLTKVE